MLYFYGEELVPLLGEGLHVLGEFLELLLEHFFEDALNLPRREAEIATVWGGTVALLFFAWVALRKTGLWMRQALHRSAQWQAHQSQTLRERYESVSDLNKFLVSVALALVTWLLFYLLA